MAKITIEDIQHQVQLYQWECLETEYKNLQTPMRFKCNEGHLVESTWGKLRNKLVCPVCINNVTRKIANISAKPKTDLFRILALDQSSHKTGYSIYDGKELISYGVYETQNGTQLERIVEVCDWLNSMINNWKPDLVAMEETQYNTTGGVGHDVFKLLSQVMGAIMLTAARNKCDVDSVLIPTWRHYCGVKGNKRTDQKRSAQLLVKKWYDVTVTDDESDAICIGKYFADKYAEKEDVIGDNDW